MRQSTESRLPSWGTLRRAWHDFFHEPVDPRVCAIVRIGYATLVLVNLAVLWPDINLWFGEEGVLAYDVARRMIHDNSWSILGWLPRTSLVLHVCLGIYAAQTVCLLLGLFSRLNVVCVFVWLISFQNANPLLLDGEDTVFRVVGFFLIFMPLGRAWALDALLRRKGETPPPASGWALRMLQIQMAVIYLSAALVKMQGESWMNGTAMYYVARLEDYFGRFPIPYLLFDTPALVAGFTWAVVAAEFIVPILVWFKETRVPCLVIAAIFHIGCDYTMNLFLFHWIMLVGWTAFLTPEDIDRLARLVRWKT
jgi:hypothetical protein